AGDGDPLDVLVIVEEPTFTGCRLRVRPIGTLLMIDEKGSDEKILGVPVDDPRFTHIQLLADLQEHWKLEIANFFRTYKDLQGVQTDVRDWRGAEDAWRVIAESVKRYEEQHSAM
ncbi:MAG TPA: inorganic diphosphatase, partial [Ktedonobacterales bacterium]|nr:inorganic diphosphatase [Ktedonobacterales bacterium]